MGKGKIGKWLLVILYCLELAVERQTMKSYVNVLVLLTFCVTKLLSNPLRTMKLYQDINLDFHVNFDYLYSKEPTCHDEDAQCSSDVQFTVAKFTGSFQHNSLPSQTSVKKANRINGRFYRLAVKIYSEGVANFQVSTNFVLKNEAQRKIIGAVSQTFLVYINNTNVVLTQPLLIENSLPNKYYIFYDFERNLQYEIKWGVRSIEVTCENDERIACQTGNVVCLNESSQDCTHLRGNFELTTKLIQFENKDLTSGTCEEAAYACTDYKCDESKPLARISSIKSNITIIEKSDYWIDSRVSTNVTKRLVPLQILVVSTCGANITRHKYSFGTFQFGTTSPFRFSNGSIRIEGVVKLSCKPGYEGDTCQQPCLHCQRSGWNCGLKNGLNEAVSGASCDYLVRCGRPICICWNGGECLLVRKYNVDLNWLENYQTKCVCKPGYTGQYCQSVRGTSCLHKICTGFSGCFETYNNSVGLEAKCRRLRHKNNNSTCENDKCKDLRSLELRINYSPQLENELIQSCTFRHLCHKQLTFCVGTNCKVALEVVNYTTALETVADLKKVYSMTFLLKQLDEKKITITLRNLSTNTDSNAVENIANTKEYGFEKTVVGGLELKPKVDYLLSVRLFFYANVTQD